MMKKLSMPISQKKILRLIPNMTESPNMTKYNYTTRYRVWMGPVDFLWKKKLSYNTR
jgi:hypothetical protein